MFCFVAKKKKVRGVLNVFFVGSDRYEKRVDGVGLSLCMSGQWSSIDVHVRTSTARDGRGCVVIDGDVACTRVRSVTRDAAHRPAGLTERASDPRWTDYPYNQRGDDEGHELTRTSYFVCIYVRALLTGELFRKVRGEENHPISLKTLINSK